MQQQQQHHRGRSFVGSVAAVAIASLAMLVFIFFATIWFPQKTDFGVLFTANTAPKQQRQDNIIPVVALNTDEESSALVATTLPGLFYQNQLYLQGVRLTADDRRHQQSQQHDDKHLSIDLFGIPSNWFRAHNIWTPDINPNPTCRSNQTTINNQNNQETLLPLKDTLLTYEQVTTNYQFSCQVLIPTIGGDRNEKQPHLMIPMQFVPIITGDVNLEGCTYIARCDISDLMARKELWQHLDSLQVKIFIGPSSTSPSSTTTTASAPQKHDLVATIDIPLQTGVAGHAGPQIIQHEKEKYGDIVSQQQQPSMEMGLCVPTHGLLAQTYLLEFVQHHLNLGVEQIMIGIDALLDSTEVYQAKRLLGSYIDQGMVVIAAYGTDPSIVVCDTDFMKYQFYHTCLYHFKGVAATYVGFWDVDEYFIPSSRQSLDSMLSPSESDDPKHQFWRQSNEIPAELEDNIEVTTTPESPSSLPLPSTQAAFVSPHVANDNIWKASNYSTNPSIVDVMTAVDEYYQRLGCGDEWCYHVFLSYAVHLDGPYFEGEHPAAETRTHSNGLDFAKRETVSRSQWQKSIARTSVANMGGIHIPGSCRGLDTYHPSDASTANSLEELYHEFSKRETCHARKFRPSVLGSIHHFYSMVSSRDDMFPSSQSGLPIDEYITMYGKTVRLQLDQLPGHEKQQHEILTSMRNHH